MPQCAGVASTVLLLDDDAQFRNSVTPALEALGLRVLNATKGSVAREMIDDAEPTLLIVDGLLPDINGIIWLEELRADNFRTPVIFVSAFYRDLATFRHLTQDLDVVKVFHKPVIMDRFSREVANVLSSLEDREAQDEAAPAPQDEQDLSDRILFPEDPSEPGVDPE